MEENGIWSDWNNVITLNCFLFIYGLNKIKTRYTISIDDGVCLWSSELFDFCVRLLDQLSGQVLECLVVGLNPIWVIVKIVTRCDTVTPHCSLRGSWVNAQVAFWSLLTVACFSCWKWMFAGSTVSAALWSRLVWSVTKRLCMSYYHKLNRPIHLYLHLLPPPFPLLR